MNIEFNTKKLKKRCSERAKAIKAYGEHYAKFLFTRLTQLEAADKLKDFRFDDPHPLTGDRMGEFAITIHDKFRIVFEAREPIPKAKDGSTNWKSVTRIKVTEIGDYH